MAAGVEGGVWGCLCQTGLDPAVWVIASGAYCAGMFLMAVCDACLLLACLPLRRLGSPVGRAWLRCWTSLL